MMITPCAVIGDSVAVGISRALPQCAVDATVGISAARFDTAHHPIAGLLTIISLGSNPGANDAAHLTRIRGEISGRVVWVLPAARDRDLVAEIAAARGDLIVDVRDGGAGPGHIHPSGRGYREIAAEIITMTGTGA